MPHITEAFARSTPLPTAGQALVYDDKIPGFGLRLGAGGARAYFVEVRLHRRARRVTLGRVGTLSCAEARRAALKERVEVRGPGGQDRPKSIAALWERMHAEDRQRLRPRTLVLYEGYWRNHVSPALGTRTLKGVTPGDVSKILNTIEGAVLANRVHEVLRRLFTYAQRHEWIERNPATGWPRRHEIARESYLSPRDLAALFVALPENEVGDALRFAAVTGARSGEVLSLRAGDLRNGGEIWLKPATSTKQKKAHRVPLSGVAQTLVQRQWQRHREQVGGTLDGRSLVFARADGGPIKKLWKTWFWALKRAGLPADLHIHDLRHSLASLLVSEQGASLALVGAALGHTSTQTTARYAHLADASLRAALDKAGASVVGPDGLPTNVVPLRRGQRTT